MGKKIKQSTWKKISTYSDRGWGNIIKPLKESTTETLGPNQSEKKTKRQCTATELNNFHRILVSNTNVNKQCMIERFKPDQNTILVDVRWEQGKELET